MRPSITSAMAAAVIQRRTRSQAPRRSAAAAGLRATSRATCSWIPQSAATASIQPSVDASEKMPNASADRRRAATTVIMKIEPLPAASANVLYTTRRASLSFGLRNELSATVSQSLESANSQRRFAMHAAGVPHRTRGKLLGTGDCASTHMVANAAFAGVVLLSLLTPFEATRPLVRLPSQSISSLEAALLVSFGAWALALVASATAPDWRTRFTAPWVALVAAMALASVLSPVSRANALHMTGRVAAAFGVFLLTIAGITTRARLRIALAAAVFTGASVSLLAVLEYLQLPSILRVLTVFRPGLATVGAQVRATGSLQYPTIASMYLEVVFAFGLGLLLI